MIQQPSRHKNPNANVTCRFQGALGLVALKNLLEEGFDATGIERNPYPGGLWKYTEDNRTSVLQCECPYILDTVPCPVMLQWPLTCRP